MKYLYIISFLFFALVACEEEKPELFYPDRYIRLTFGSNPGENYYKRSYTFAFEKDGVTDKVFRFPVQFNGNDLTGDLKFRVAVVDTMTTLPAECYDLPLEQVFRAGRGNVDTVEITVHRKPVLKEGVKVLRFELVKNENFEPYTRDSVYIELHVSDVVDRPEWWEEGGVVELSYLGKYSYLKYLTFAEETGIQDFGVLTPSEKRHYAIKFKRALEAKPREDVDGTTMKVPIAG